MLVMGLVHSVSLFVQPVAHNDTERQLNDLMNNYRFQVPGAVRTMRNFLQGFSIAFMLAALGFATLDLVLARERSGLLKRVALINVIWLALMVANSLHYFFLVPTTFLGITLLLFFLAWLKLPADIKA